MPQDPQRSSAGSATISDDAIAGFSASDRPSVSDMGGSSGGSGRGESIEHSDPGEAEPKSSNDGSGDDGNRRSPSTRDSSPGDPASSGSRENTPNSNMTDGSEANISSPREQCALATNKDQKPPASEPMSVRPTGDNDRIVKSEKKGSSGDRSNQNIRTESEIFPAQSQTEVHVVSNVSIPKPSAPVRSSGLREPRSIAELCSAAPEETHGADGSRKRPRSIASKGMTPQNTNAIGEEKREEASKRRRPDNTTVKALLTTPQDPQPRGREPTVGTQHTPTTTGKPEPI